MANDGITLEALKAERQRRDLLAAAKAEKQRRYTEYNATADKVMEARFGKDPNADFNRLTGQADKFASPKQQYEGIGSVPAPAWSGRTVSDPLPPVAQLPENERAAIEGLGYTEERLLTDGGRAIPKGYADPSSFEPFSHGDPYAYYRMRDGSVPEGAPYLVGKQREQYSTANDSRYQDYTRFADPADPNSGRGQLADSIRGYEKGREAMPPGRYGNALTGIESMGRGVAADFVENPMQAIGDYSGMSSLRRGMNDLQEGGGKIRQGNFGEGAYQYTRGVGNLGMGASEVIPMAKGAGRLFRDAEPAIEGASGVVRAVNNGPRQQAASEVVDVLDMSSGSIRPQTIKAIENVLVNSTDLPRPLVRSKIKVALSQLGDLGEGGFAFARALEREFADALPGTADEGLPALRSQIGELSTQAGKSEKGRAVVMGQIQKDIESEVPRLDGKAGAVFGQESRNQSVKEIKKSLTQMGNEAYDPLIKGGAKDQASHDRLVELLYKPRIQKLFDEIAEDVEREEIDLDEFIRTRPAEAAHWAQSKARKLAESKATIGLDGKLKPDRLMTDRRWDLLDVLEEAVPGYLEVRLKYGDEAGAAKAVKMGDKFISLSKDPMKLDEFLDDYEDLSEIQKQAANMSIRDAIIKPLKSGGENKSARISQLESIGVLEALERIPGVQGKELADEIRAIRDQRAFVGSLKTGRTGSNTADKLADRSQAPAMRSGALGRAAGGSGNVLKDVILSGLMGQPLPVNTMAGAGGSGLRKIFQPGVKTRNQMAEILSAPARQRNALSGMAEPPSNPR